MLCSPRRLICTQTYLFFLLRENFDYRDLCKVALTIMENRDTFVLSRKRNPRCATLVYAFFAQLGQYTCTELLFSPTPNSRGSEYTPVFEEWYFCGIFFSALHQKLRQMNRSATDIGTKQFVEGTCGSISATLAHQGTPAFLYYSAPVCLNLNENSQGEFVTHFIPYSIQLFRYN